jgi:hypothetical protein
MTAFEEYTCDCGGQRVMPVGGPRWPCLACEAYATVESAALLDRDRFMSLLDDAGRDHGAALLYHAYTLGVIDDDTVTACAGPAWSGGRVS